LIDGLDLKVEFDLPQAWLVTLLYNPPSPIPGLKRPAFFWQRIFWRGKKSSFQSVLNKHYPWIKIILWKPFPEVIRIPLNIDTARIHAIKLPDSLHAENFRRPVNPTRFFAPTVNIKVPKMSKFDITLINTQPKVAINWQELSEIQKSKLNTNT
jgi:hypothetical protein